MISSICCCRRAVRRQAAVGGRLRAFLSGGAPLPTYAQDFMQIAMCVPVLQVRPRCSLSCTGQSCIRLQPGPIKLGLRPIIISLLFSVMCGVCGFVQLVLIIQWKGFNVHKHLVQPCLLTWDIPEMRGISPSGADHGMLLTDMTASVGSCKGIWPHRDCWSNLRAISQPPESCGDRRPASARWEQPPKPPVVYALVECIRTGRCAVHCTTISCCAVDNYNAL